jgi:predicted PurR-regulated permease PerM
MSTTASALRELPRFLLAVLFILLLVLGSLWILRPFLPALVWATLIVASTWQLMISAQKHLGGKRSLAVLVMTSALLLIVVLPMAGAVMTIASHSDDLAARLTEVAQAGLPAPPGWVERLPLVGPKLAARWQAVAQLGTDELQAMAAPYFKTVAGWVVGQAGGLATFFFHLLLTVVLSVLLYSQGEMALAGLRAFAIRLAGPRGDQSVTLGGQAIRAVALGVVVTAVVQSALGGIGLFVAGVPFAGFLTSLMLVLAIAQIGAGPVLLLALGWLYWSGHTWTAMMFLPWALFVGILDNVLRPVLIKRGANLPLVLIFAGVIGGLVAFGIVGLFVGPVVLAIAYTQLSAWVNEGVPAAEPTPLPVVPAAVPVAVATQPGVTLS